MKITDRRILLLPALIAIGAYISSRLHTYIPVLSAAEIGFVGFFFLRTAEQKKIATDTVLLSIIGILFVCIGLAIYAHK